MGFYYTVFETAMGWVGVLGSDIGLVQATMPRPSAEAALGELRIAGATISPTAFDGLRASYQAYLSGQRIDFAIPLDLPAASAFRRRVWDINRQIAYGDTRSYLWVARQVGQPGAGRAVGQALARNPVPIIIPCHRVVGSRGRTGGYSGGVEMKKRLLGLEAAGRTG